MTTEMNLALPTDDRDVVALTQRAHAIVEAADAMIVADEDGAKVAGAFLLETAAASKLVDKRRKFFVDPLNAHVKAINDLFRRLTTPFNQADGIVRGKMLAYRREQEARAEAERRRLDAEELARRQEAERARREADAAAQAAREQANAPAAERAAFEAHVAAERAAEDAAKASLVSAAVAAAPVATKTVATDAGRVTFRKVWKFEVVDPSAVPREFLVVDEKAIRRAVERGVREIAGVRVYEDETTVVAGTR